MPDIYLRAVPSDPAIPDVRLYADGADAPPAEGGALSLRMLMGMGLSLLLAMVGNAAIAGNCGKV